MSYRRSITTAKEFHRVRRRLRQA